MFGAVLFGLWGWFQRLKAERASRSLLPRNTPEYRPDQRPRSRHSAWNARSRG